MLRVPVCVLYSAALFSFIKSVNPSSSLVRLRESPARYYTDLPRSIESPYAGIRLLTNTEHFHGSLLKMAIADA